MKRGVLISIEGTDGAGKSTQIEYLKEYLEDRGVDFVTTREPGGTDISEKIRDIILDKANDQMDDRAEALLYAASRAQLMSEVIEKKLSQGVMVVCDRFIDSSMAYQGYGRGLGTDVSKINEFATRDVLPDITILLAVTPEESMKRIDRKFDRLEGEEISFHRKVYDGYMKLAEENPERIKVIDAERSKEEIRDDMIALIEKVLTKRGI